VARPRVTLPLAVAGAVGLLLLAGRLAPPPKAPPAPAPPRPVADLRASCDPGGVERRYHAPTDGPWPTPPVAGLALQPATPAPHDLPRARAIALASTRLGGGAHLVAHARLFLVRSTNADIGAVRSTRAWVVAVAGVPLGVGFCGSLGTREVVVALDARRGTELLRYSYR
jgi:hypothetical protein